MRICTVFILAIVLVLHNSCVPVLPSTQEITPPASDSPAKIAIQNRPPVIQSLKAPVMVVTGSKSQVSCIAEDPDGNAVIFEWSVTGGILQGDGSAVQWTAPGNPGNYSITVKVTDTGGGEVTRLVNVRVVSMPAHPPLIKEFTVKIQQPSAELTIDPEVPMADRTVPVVRASRSVEIECVVDNPDGYDLAYTWDMPGGRIIGEGGKIMWMAPTQPKRYIMTVTVTDLAGNSSTAMLAFDVSCCAY